MKLRVNGETVDVTAGNLAALIATRVASPQTAPGLAVAVNGEVVPRGQWHTDLREGDSVEILTANPGG